MVKINGRGLRKPLLTVLTSPGGLTLRVDDDGNDQFWLELSVQFSEVLAWVTLMRQRRASGPGNLDVVRYDQAGNMIAEGGEK